MTTQNRNNIVAAVLMAVLGILFIVWQSKVITVCMTILGIMLLVQAVLELITRHLILCAVKAVIGVVLIIFGWKLVSFSLYVMAAVLLIYGIIQLVYALKGLATLHTPFAKIIGFFQPVICLVIAGLLLFNQGGTVTWVFIVSGIFLLVQALFALLSCVITNRDS